MRRESGAKRTFRSVKRGCDAVVSVFRAVCHKASGIIDSHLGNVTKHEFMKDVSARTSGARNLLACCSGGRAPRRASVLATRLISFGASGALRKGKNSGQWSAGSSGAKRACRREADLSVNKGRKVFGAWVLPDES
jgi:hypothetical protein